MDIRFVTEPKADALAVMAGEGGALAPAAAALDARLGGALGRAIAASRFTGQPGQVVEVLGAGEIGRALVIGAGALDRLDPLAVERWAGHAVRRTLASGAERLALQPEPAGGVTAAEAAARAAMGVRLAAYRFDRYRTRVKQEQKPSLLEVQVVCEGPAAAQARFENDEPVITGALLARDLVSEPPNVLHPEEFARRAQELQKLGVEVEVLGTAELEAMGAGSLLAVGKGSARQTMLVTMMWRGARAKSAQPVCLVGKGVTFDAGGISLKPGANMDEMRGDMAGAAAVLGAMQAIAARKARANVCGVIGLVENMPDANATRPGDIVTSLSGQTIEILNTDAEGRLLLADAIWHAQDKFNPIALVDLATLTGAIIISLGHEHAGMFCNDDALAHALTHAGQQEGESVWRMPLGPAYDRMIDSPNADMKNISGKTGAGSIVGAQFIQRFIKPGLAWAHLDIAGMAWKPGPYEDPLSPAWATGFGVRLLNRLVANTYEE
jgi:leucyl aminopeptidase